MKIFDTILPEQFKTWIQFYDHICRELPDLNKSEGEGIVKFELPVDLQKTIASKYFVYKVEYIRAQCWLEIENFRPTEKELYHYMSAANGSIFPEEIKKINKLFDLLLKS
jgi:hypothetical protein